MWYLEKKFLIRIKSILLIFKIKLGDVEAIVVLNEETSKQKNYKVLTRLHTLNTYPKDRERIEKNNGKIVDQSGVKRLEGLYSITRGFGFHGDKNVKKFISATPSIKSYKIESNYACLIVATKGLWNTLNYKTVSDLVIEVSFKYKKKIIN